MIERLIKFPVVLTGGYFAVFFLLCMQSVAQQPGGVKGTKAWYVSNKGGSLLKDTSGHSYASFRTTKNDRTFNFHPSALLTGSSLDVKFENMGFNQGTIVGIFYPDKGNQQALEIDSDTLNYKIRDDKIIKKTKNNEYSYSYGNSRLRTTLDIDGTYTKEENAMKTLSFHSAIARNYLSVWGENKSTNILQKFKGYLPEFIIYNRVLDATEIWKVQSYLAMKYGITLDTSYLIGDGSIIWDINDPRIRKYRYRVCAISKDSASGLVQPKSNSSYQEGYLSNNYSSSFFADQLFRNYTIIPQIDSPSLFKSLTLGFSDIKSVKEGTYIIWGDDDVSIPDIASEQFPPNGIIQNVNRTWLLRNPSKSNALIRVVLAGKSYDSKAKATIFEKIYAPYDYQFYRYVLIKLNSDNIKDTSAVLLNNYFGREQSKNQNDENFNTRFLVWDSVSLKNTELNYFTFGRVPLLSFWEVHVPRTGRSDIIKLKYIYDRGLPLRSNTNFDTAVTSFKKDSSIILKLSLGINPITIRYKEDLPRAIWQTISDTISNESYTPDSSYLAPIIAPKDSAIIEQSEEEKQGDKRYITKRPWKKELPLKYVKLRKLKTDTVYIVEATDKLGQKTILRLKLKSTPH